MHGSWPVLAASAHVGTHKPPEPVPTLPVLVVVVPPPTVPELVMVEPVVDEAVVVAVDVLPDVVAPGPFPELAPPGPPPDRPSTTTLPPQPAKIPPRIRMDIVFMIAV
jgi:hypothetical protein